MVRSTTRSWTDPLRFPRRINRRVSGANCGIPTICCSQNLVRVLGRSGSRRSWFALDGWGQRVLGLIKGLGPRCRFGRGDNGAQRHPHHHQIRSRYLQVRIPGLRGGPSSSPLAHGGFGFTVPKEGEAWPEDNWFVWRVNGRSCTSTGRVSRRF